MNPSPLQVVRPIWMQMSSRNLQPVNDLLGVVAVEADAPGPIVDDLRLLGPRRGPLVERYLGPADGDAGEVSEAVAWGLWADRTMPPELAPVVQVFRRVPGLGARPVLVSENKLCAGDFLVVTADCDAIVALPLITGAADAAFLHWFSWRGAPAQARPAEADAVEASEDDPDLTPPHEHRTLRAAGPWLSGASLEGDGRLSPEHPALQITPMLPDAQSDDLARAIAAGPWCRRAGDIYSQDCLDLGAWVDAGAAPEVVRSLVARIRAPEMPARVGQTVGVEVEALRELFAYRLRAGERILRHSDTQYEGQLLVRINWLLAVSETPARPYDLRFWDPSDGERLRYAFPARPNHAVFFLIGDDNPHDVPVMPPDASPRINLVLTFGRSTETVS